jgi:putative ABC transport system ATP-binding protein
MAMIRLEGVKKCYGQRCVLQGIDLTVGEGEFIGIMGSSGSGKSTLLNLVGGMDFPDEGRIWVDGEDLSTYGEGDLTLYRRHRVGFIFQFFNLLPNISVFENVELPLLLGGEKGYEDKVSHIIREVGLEGKEKRFPAQLSGGEQQRVAIARALIHEPDILLADEPTGNLDSRTGKRIMEMIEQISDMTVKTILLVTHDRTVAAFATRTLRIEDGLLG